MWYGKIVESLDNLPGFIDYYEKELEEAKLECSVKGNLEQNLSRLPGITENRFSQLQEIEAVLEYLNIQSRKLHKKYFQQYLEHYQRALSSRDVEKYVSGEEEVLNMDLLVNEVALLRNKYLAIMKGLEYKMWNCGHITKLKVAGLDDVSIR